MGKGGPTGGFFGGGGREDVRRKKWDGRKKRGKNLSIYLLSHEHTIPPRTRCPRIKRAMVQCRGRTYASMRSPNADVAGVETRGGHDASS